MFQLPVTDARQQGGVGDLVAIEMQDGKNSPVVDGIEEFVRVPTGRQRAGLCLAIAYHTSDPQVCFVQGSAVGMCKRVTQFPTFIDGTWCFWGHMAGDATWERELGEQLLHALLVLRDVRVQLAVRALQVRVGHHTRCAVARASDINHVQIILLDDPVKMDIDEVQPWRCAPVTKQSWLDMLGLQRSFQQRIVVQVNLAGRQVVSGTPVSVHPPQKVWGKRSIHNAPPMAAASFYLMAVSTSESSPEISVILEDSIDHTSAGCR